MFGIKELSVAFLLVYILTLIVFKIIFEKQNKNFKIELQKKDEIIIKLNEKNNLIKQKADSLNEENNKNYNKYAEEFLKNSKLISKNANLVNELEQLNNEKENLDKELEICQRLLKQDNDFNKVYNLVQQGENVFITGGAGTGKSYILQHLREYIPELKNNITSTTGISAVNIDGVTIHSWAGIGKIEGIDYNKRYTDSERAELIEKIASNKAKYAKKAVKDRIKSTKLLAIDEISMLSDDMFRILNLYFQKIRNSDSPFGGIQMILIGDFCQLPPVIGRKDESPDKSLHYSFCCQSWKKLKLNTVLLKTFHRQEKDIEFAKHLDNIRLGKNLDDAEIYLSDCVIDKTQDNTNILHVFHTNEEVKTHNEIQLKNFSQENIISINAKHYFVKPVLNDNELKYKIIPGKTVTKEDYTSINKDTEKETDNIEKETKALNKLELSSGCKVMIIKNIDVGNGIANGSIGYVSEITEDCIYVDFKHFKKYPIKKESFVYYDEYSSRYIMRIQFPLILAYAVTIHKSQGLTFDEIVVGINPNDKHISCGQIYVAMSRVKTKEGLFILNQFPKKFIITDEKVSDFYSNL